MRIGSSKQQDEQLAPGQEQAQVHAGSVQGDKKRHAALSPAQEAQRSLKIDLRPQLMALDAKSLRRKTVIVGLLLLVVAGVSLCVDLYQGRMASPVEVLQIYALWVQQCIANLAGDPNVMTPAQLMELYPSYYSMLGRAATTFVTVLAGALLALAGTLYQSVFKNPIASPSMLGVSGGIQLGHMVLVLVFGTSAATLTGWRYGFVYGFALAMLVLIFILSKVMSGKGKPLNIINMLVMGTIMSQLASVVVTYVSWNVFDDEMWTIYNNLSEVLSVDTSGVAMAILLVMTIVSVLPVLLLRFRLNVLSFSEQDMRMLGVNAHGVQLIALTCGTLMMIASQVAVGTVSMISLVVPHISRSLFGAEFRKQFVGNILLGALLLVLCRVILSFVPSIASWLPIGTVVSIVVLPAFVWILAMQQRSWE